MRFPFLAGLVAFLALPTAASGQGLMETPIGFRTGLTEGPVITRLGTLTIDAGTSIRWAGDRKTFRLGEFNIRVPFTRRIEGRFYGNSLALQDTRGDVVVGREDLAVAVAARLTRYRGIRPVSALIVRLDTPSGTLPGRETSWRPGARLSFGWELPGRIALHTNLGVARDTREGRGFSREIASVWMARRLSGPFGGYVELFGSTREMPDGANTGYLHGGLTWQVLSWMHVDLHGVVGSSSAGSPRWIGIGVRQRA